MTIVPNIVNEVVAESIRMMSSIFHRYLSPDLIPNVQGVSAKPAGGTPSQRGMSRSDQATGAPIGTLPPAGPQGVPAASEQLPAASVALLPEELSGLGALLSTLTGGAQYPASVQHNTGAQYNTAPTGAPQAYPTQQQPPKQHQQQHVQPPPQQQYLPQQQQQQPLSQQQPPQQQSQQQYAVPVAPQASYIPPQQQQLQPQQGEYSATGGYWGTPQGSVAAPPAHSYTGAPGQFPPQVLASADAPQGLSNGAVYEAARPSGQMPPPQGGNLDVLGMLGEFSPEFGAGVLAACEGATGGLTLGHMDRGLLGSMAQLAPQQWGAILTNLQHTDMSKIHSPGTITPEYYSRTLCAASRVCYLPFFSRNRCGSHSGVLAVICAPNPDILVGRQLTIADTLVWCDICNGGISNIATGCTVMARIT